MDGLGAASYALSIDEFNFDNVPLFKFKLSLCKKLIIFLTYPFTFTRTSLRILFMPCDRNSIQSGKKCCGEKVGAHHMDFDLPMMK